MPQAPVPQPCLLQLLFQCAIPACPSSPLGSEAARPPKQATLLLARLLCQGSVVRLCE